MGGTGAEEPLDELVGPEHPLSVQKHVDHVQDPGCQEAQEANQEVGYVEPAQGFHFVLQHEESGLSCSSTIRQVR